MKTVEGTGAVTGYTEDSHAQQFVCLLRDCLEGATGKGLGIKVLRSFCFALFFFVYSCIISTHSIHNCLLIIIIVCMCRSLSWLK